MGLVKIFPHVFNLCPACAIFYLYLKVITLAIICMIRLAESNFILSIAVMWIFIVAVHIVWSLATFFNSKVILQSYSGIYLSEVEKRGKVYNMKGFLSFIVIFMEVSGAAGADSSSAEFLAAGLKDQGIEQQFFSYALSLKSILSIYPTNYFNLKLAMIAFLIIMLVLIFLSSRRRSICESLRNRLFFLLVAKSNNDIKFESNRIFLKKEPVMEAYIEYSLLVLILLILVLFVFLLLEFILFLSYGNEYVEFRKKKKEFDYKSVVSEMSTWIIITTLYLVCFSIIAAIGNMYYWKGVEQLFYDSIKSPRILIDNSSPDIKIANLYRAKANLNNSLSNHNLSKELLLFENFYENSNSEYFQSKAKRSLERAQAYQLLEQTLFQEKNKVFTSIKFDTGSIPCIYEEKKSMLQTIFNIFLNMIYGNDDANTFKKKVHEINPIFSSREHFMKGLSFDSVSQNKNFFKNIYGSNEPSLSTFAHALDLISLVISSKGKLFINNDIFRAYVSVCIRNVNHVYYLTALHIYNCPSFKIEKSYFEEVYNPEIFQRYLNPVSVKKGSTLINDFLRKFESDDPFIQKFYEVYGIYPNKYQREFNGTSWCMFEPVPSRMGGSLDKCNFMEAEDYWRYWSIRHSITASKWRHDESQLKKLIFFTVCFNNFKVDEVEDLKNSCPSVSLLTLRTKNLISGAFDKLNPNWSGIWIEEKQKKYDDFLQLSGFDNPGHKAIKKENLIKKLIDSVSLRNALTSGFTVGDECVDYWNNVKALNFVLLDKIIRYKVLTSRLHIYPYREVGSLPFNIVSDLMDWGPICEKHKLGPLRPKYIKSVFEESWKVSNNVLKRMKYDGFQKPQEVYFQPTFIEKVLYSVKNVNFSLIREISLGTRPSEPNNYFINFYGPDSFFSPFFVIDVNFFFKQYYESLLMKQSTLDSHYIDLKILIDKPIFSCFQNENSTFPKFTWIKNVFESLYVHWVMKNVFNSDKYLFWDIHFVPRNFMSLDPKVMYSNYFYKSFSPILDLCRAGATPPKMEFISEAYTSNKKLLSYPFSKMLDWLDFDRMFFSKNQDTLFHISNIEAVCSNLFKLNFIIDVDRLKSNSFYTSDLYLPSLYNESLFNHPIGEKNNPCSLKKLIGDIDRFYFFTQILKKKEFLDNATNLESFSVTQDTAFPNDFLPVKYFLKFYNIFNQEKEKSFSRLKSKMHICFLDEIYESAANIPLLNNIFVAGREKKIEEAYSIYVRSCLKNYFIEDIDTDSYEFFKKRADKNAFSRFRFKCDNTFFKFTLYNYEVRFRFHWLRNIGEGTGGFPSRDYLTYHPGTYVEDTDLLVSDRFLYEPIANYQKSTDLYWNNLKDTLVINFVKKYKDVNHTLIENVFNMYKEIKFSPLGNTEILKLDFLTTLKNLHKKQFESQPGYTGQGFHIYYEKLNFKFLKDLLKKKDGTFSVILPNFQNNKKNEVNPSILDYFTPLDFIVGNYKYHHNSYFLAKGKEKIIFYFDKNCVYITRGTIPVNVIESALLSVSENWTFKLNLFEDLRLTPSTSMNLQEAHMVNSEKLALSINNFFSNLILFVEKRKLPYLIKYPLLEVLDVVVGNNDEPYLQNTGSLSKKIAIQMLVYIHDSIPGGFKIKNSYKNLNTGLPYIPKEAYYDDSFDKLTSYSILQKTSLVIKTKTFQAFFSYAYGTLTQQITERLLTYLVGPELPLEVRGFIKDQADAYILDHIPSRHSVIIKIDDIYNLYLQYLADVEEDKNILEGRLPERTPGAQAAYNRRKELNYFHCISQLPITKKQIASYIFFIELARSVYNSRK